MKYGICRLIIGAVLAATCTVFSARADGYQPDVQQRPSDSSMLHATAGLFTSYSLFIDLKKHEIAQRLVIFDLTKGRDIAYTVSPQARFEEKVMDCPLPQNVTMYSGFVDQIKQYHLCPTMPAQLIPGKTMLTLLWWTPTKPGPPGALIPWDPSPTTDEIHLVQR